MLKQLGPKLRMVLEVESKRVRYKDQHPCIEMDVQGYKVAVDLNIVDLVATINKHQQVVTTYSCEGNDTELFVDLAYVSIHGPLASKFAHEVMVALPGIILVEATQQNLYKEMNGRVLRWCKSDTGKVLKGILQI